MVVFQFPNREQRYAFISPQIGPTHVIFKAITKDIKPVDILILGSSLAMCALDPIILEKELTKQLGRPSVVLNLSVHWRGEEIPFLLLSEILKQRKVKMLIWSSPETITWTDEPHALAFHFWENKSYFKNLQNLSLINQLQYYTGTILSFPRLAYLGFTHGSTFERPIFDMIDDYGPNGGLARKLAFRNNVRLDGKRISYKFEEYHKESPAIVENDFVYSESNSCNFSFGNIEVNSYQKAFLKKIGSLCLTNGITLACFKNPTLMDHKYDQIRFPTFWSEHFSQSVTYMGIQSKKLFPNTDENERKKFYTDSHLNANGQRYLSQTIAPVLASFYAQKIQ